MNTLPLPAQKLERLLGFLERDPTNPTLLADAATAAFEARDMDGAASLLDRAELAGPLPPPLLNMRALIAMAQARFSDAASDLQSLVEQGEKAPAVRFNLAWALARTARYDEADDLLDTETMAVSARAPALKIHVLHHLERYDEALELGAVLAERHPADEELMGALATLAMDADREDLAKTYAARAGGNPEGLAARGMFALEDEDFAGAAAMFEQALERQPGNPRAWVGKGLALLSSQDAAGAAAAIDQGASIFEDHLGSWIAAGWAHFIAGQIGEARDRFERVVAIDPTFAEGHGGIAVLDVMRGDTDAARRNSDIALRLDRSSMGGALAKSLLMQAQGNPEAAEKIRAVALNAPIGPGGKTLAQILASSASGFLRP